MTEKILLVDDDSTVLRSYKRHLSLEFDIDIALGGREGLHRCEQDGPYAVIVSDMRMPGMDGTRFLTEVRTRWPETVRMLLTGQADMKDAIAVINEGQIFRFLTKPCTPECFSKALTDAIWQYQLITAEKELLDETLKGSIKLLLDVLSVVNPEVFSQSVRVCKLANQIGQYLKLDDLWQVDLAALFAQIGCVTIPPDIQRKKYEGVPLDASEQEMFGNQLKVGQNLLAGIPRLEKVSEAIAYQEKNFDGSGLPNDQRRGEDIPIIARILRVVHDYDHWSRQSKTIMEAINHLQSNSDYYDPAIVEALEVVQGRNSGEFVVRDIDPRYVRCGMIVAADVRTRTNILLMGKGQEVSETTRQCISNFAEHNNVAGPIKVIQRCAVEEPEGLTTP